MNCTTIKYSRKPGRDACAKLKFRIALSSADHVVINHSKMDIMNEIIAERKIYSISTDGQKNIFKIAIGKPYPVDDVSWACPVKIDGLHMTPVYFYILLPGERF